PRGRDLPRRNHGFSDRFVHLAGSGFGPHSLRVAFPPRQGPHRRRSFFGPPRLQGAEEGVEDVQVMLAAKADLDKIRFPVLASPKIDGVRAVVLGGVVLSRNMKPIPNRHVQSLFGNKVFGDLDGELVVGKPNDPDVFRKTTSGVMSVEGDRKSTRLNSSHVKISYAVFCLKKKNLMTKVC